MAWAAFDRVLFFVKSNHYWAYSDSGRQIAHGSTYEWSNFPAQVSAAQVIGTTNDSMAVVEFSTPENVKICELTDNQYSFYVNCNRGQREYDRLERQVGFPIAASVQLNGGHRLIFGSEFMCVSPPPNNRVGDSRMKQNQLSSFAFSAFSCVISFLVRCSGHR